MRDVSLPDAWEQSFDRWLEPFLTAFGHKVRRKWAPIYVRGLLMPGERKSVEPLAARVAPDDVEQLHHFVGNRPTEPALARPGASALPSGAWDESGGRGRGGRRRCRSGGV